MGKYAPFFLLPPRETEEAAIGRRRWLIRPFWATAAARNEGEGEGRCSGGDPGLTSGWGGAQRRGEASRWRQAGMAAAAALRVRRGG